MKEALKQWLRSYGVTKQHLNFPQYYVPYLVGRGRAFVPQSLTEFPVSTVRCAGRTLPLGGAYLRVLPYAYSR